MSISTSFKANIAGVVGLAVLALPGLAAPPATIDLASESVGAEPKAFLPVVGFWRIEEDNGKKVLVVDGRQWKEGQSSVGIADKARALYGERYAEFLDRVQAYAYYPYVVVPNVENFTNGEITVRFQGLSGRIDQGAGILSISNRMAIISQYARTAWRIISCSGNSKRANVPPLAGSEIPRPPHTNGTT